MFGWSVVYDLIGKFPSYLKLPLSNFDAPTYGFDDFSSTERVEKQGNSLWSSVFGDDVEVINAYWDIIKPDFDCRTRPVILKPAGLDQNKSILLPIVVRAETTEPGLTTRFFDSTRQYATLIYQRDYIKEEVRRRIK